MLEREQAGGEDGQSNSRAAAPREHNLTLLLLLLLTYSFTDAEPTQSHVKTLSNTVSPPPSRARLAFL